MHPQGSNYHRERMEEALREEVSIILEGEIADPRIGLTTVSEVKIGSGGKAAHIFVSVAGDDAEAEQSLLGLNAAKGFIRHQLTARLQLRHCPELVFHLDRSEQFQGRIDQLLTRTERQNKRTQSKAKQAKGTQAKETPS